MGGKKQEEILDDSCSDDEESYEHLIDIVKKEAMEEIQTKDQLDKKKRRLINEIKTLSDENDRPLNVVVIGPPGVGKSSFINSIATALSWNRWREYAYTGYHGGQAIPVTAHVKSFPKCCKQDEYPNTNLPQLIDVAGFALENTPEWREVLHIVLFGRLPDGESIISAHAYCKKYGVHGLKAKYSTYEEKLKVDRLVFVGSYTEQVPKSLIDLVIEAARPTEDFEMVIPIFGVMTKADSVETISLSPEKIKEREQDFINALGLGGAKTRFLSCMNYCDDLDEKYGVRRDETYIPQLDVPILRFMKQVCDPVLTVQNRDTQYLQRENSHEQKSQPDKERTREVDIFPKSIKYYISKVIEFILIAAMLYFCATPGFDVSNLRSFCLQHGGSHSEAARKLCVETYDGSSVGVNFIGLLLLYVIIRVACMFMYKKLTGVRILADGEQWKLKVD